MSQLALAVSDPGMIRAAQKACHDFPAGAARNPHLGDVFLTTDAQIAAFSALGHDSILGNLHLGGVAPGNITSFAGLELLRYVSQDVLLVGGFFPATLAGIDNLARIDGSFQVTNTNGLSDLSALYPTLHTVGGSVSINGNVSLTSLDFCFGCLHSVGDSIDVFSNPALTSMNVSFLFLRTLGRFSLYSNPVLASAYVLCLRVTALTNVSNAAECFIVHSNPLLTTIESAFLSMSAFNNKIVVRDCALLTGFGISFVDAATATGANGGFEMKNLPVMVRPSGNVSNHPFDQLVNVTGSGEIRYENLPSATDLGDNNHTFQQLIDASAWDLYVVDCPLIPVADVLPAAQKLRDLVIDNCDGLVFVVNFANLVQVRDFQFSGNALIATIATFFAIDGGQITGNQFFIDDNPSLSSAGQVAPLIANVVGEGYAGATSNTGNAP